MALKRSRSRSDGPPAPPAKRQLPCPTGRSPSGPKVGLIGIIAARRSGRLRGPAAPVVPRSGTPPPSQQTLFRSSMSPEPADEPASPTERCRDDGGRRRKKALYLDMLTEDPRCVVLRSAARDASAGWSSLPRPPLSDRILALATYPPRRGLLASTEKGETFLLDGRRRGGAAWIALPGSTRLPCEERAVYAKDHGLWFEVSPRDGRLRAHELDVVLGSGAPRLEHKTHRVSDPIPVVITPSARGGARATRSAKLVYLGRSMFCVVQADGGVGADGCRVNVTAFRMIDSEMPATLVGRRRRRRRERGMDARWVAAELERAACADKASASGRRRKLCRVNLWSRTYIARGGADRCSSLPSVLWM